MAIKRVQWNPAKRRDFEDWIGQEIHYAVGNRGDLESKWSQDIVQWRARVVGDGVGDVPFVGASDLEMPLTAIHTDPVYADFMQTLHMPQDFWSIVGKRPDTVDVAKPLQQYLSLVERNFIQMRKVNKRSFLDMIIHGTCIYKDHIIHERHRVATFDEGGRPYKTVTRYQPAVQHVPLQDFIIPAYAWDIDADAPNGPAPWVSHRFYLTKGEFSAKAKAPEGFLPDYDPAAVSKVMRWDQDIEDPLREEQEREDSYQPWQNLKITLHEVWARFDVDGDGLEEDVVVVFHYDSRTILRATHNPFLHGKRPFEAGSYLPGLGFYGLGLAEQDEWAQLASSRILNAVIDNALLSNSIMLSVPQGMNMHADESIYPGRVWYTAQGERVQGIQMGRPVPGMYQLLNMFSQWSEQRTGVSELRQGNVSQLPGRTPATTILSVLQEGNKRFDMILGNMREGTFANIGERMLQNLAQISKQDDRWVKLAHEALGPVDGDTIAGVLRAEPAEVAEAFGVSVTATSSQTNREIEKQNLNGLGQYLGQTYPMLLQFAQGIGDPALLQETMRAGFMGTVEMQKRMLEAYDIQNAEVYVPAVPGQQPQQSGPPMQQPQQPPGAAAGGGAAPPDVMSLLGMGQ